MVSLGEDRPIRGRAGRGPRGFSIQLAVGAKNEMQFVDGKLAIVFRKIVPFTW